MLDVKFSIDLYTLVYRSEVRVSLVPTLSCPPVNIIRELFVIHRKAGRSGRLGDVISERYVLSLMWWWHQVDVYSLIVVWTSSAYCPCVCMPGLHGDKTVIVFCQYFYFKEAERPSHFSVKDNSHNNVSGRAGRCGYKASIYMFHRL